MIDVQHVDSRMYFVWLDQRVLDAMGWGSPEAIIRAALMSKLSEMYPAAFDAPDPHVPF